ncbi:MAG TPA: MBL fold metallo-hydrolase [Verrucomicrobiales bacterium]|nr:MBL fold metallo-hydrolase [Verrucomicrobiales bacterium]
MEGNQFASGSGREVVIMEKVQSFVTHLREKTRMLRQGGEHHGNAHQVGIMPKEGWRQRNVEFFNQVLIPTLFARRGGGVKSPDFAAVAGDRMGVTWIGHASFLVQIAGKNILVDPNWALWHSIVKRVRRPGIHLDELPRIDLVLLTHAHFDHLHLPTLADVARGQTILVPRGVGNLVKKMYFSRVVEMEWWDKFRFGEIEVQFTPARHWGARYVHDVHRGFGGFLISSDYGAIYHCGDSSFFGGFQEIGKRKAIDLALLPIGAYRAPSGRPVHMNPEEAVEAFVALGAKEMAPMHYATFPLGSEPLHEPLEWLVDSAVREGVADRVHLLGEGEVLVV